MPEARIDQLPWAVAWTLAEPMERSSMALASDGRVWLIDPVADEQALAAAEALGEVAAVVQLLDRHDRDCEALARRYGVRHLRLPAEVPDSPFELERIVSMPGWRELGLWFEGQEALMVPEAVGSAPYFTVSDQPLGMHPFLRAWPPGALRNRTPAHLFCGHGMPIHSGAAEALREALARSRRDIPRAGIEMIRAFGRGVRG